MNTVNFTRQLVTDTYSSPHFNDWVGFSRLSVIKCGDSHRCQYWMLYMLIEGGVHFLTSYFLVKEQCQYMTERFFDYSLFHWLLNTKWHVAYLLWDFMILLELIRNHVEVWTNLQSSRDEAASMNTQFPCRIIRTRNLCRSVLVAGVTDNKGYILQIWSWKQSNWCKETVHIDMHDCPFASYSTQRSEQMIVGVWSMDRLNS